MSTTCDDEVCRLKLAWAEKSLNGGTSHAKLTLPM
jgi:hypothetical protein